MGPYQRTPNESSNFSHFSKRLSENYFMDNKSDLEYLQNQTGKQAIIDTHVEGIEEWIESNI